MNFSHEMEPPFQTLGPRDFRVVEKECPFPEVSYPAFYPLETELKDREWGYRYGDHQVSASFDQNDRFYVFSDSDDGELPVSNCPERVKRMTSAQRHSEWEDGTRLFLHMCISSRNNMFFRMSELGLHLADQLIIPISELKLFSLVQKGQNDPDENEDDSTSSDEEEKRCTCARCQDKIRHQGQTWNQVHREYYYLHTYYSSLGDLQILNRVSWEKEYEELSSDYPLVLVDGFPFRLEFREVIPPGFLRGSQIDQINPCTAEVRLGRMGTHLSLWIPQDLARQFGWDSWLDQTILLNDALKKEEDTKNPRKNENEKWWRQPKMCSQCFRKSHHKWCRVNREQQDFQISVCSHCQASMCLKCDLLFPWKEPPILEHQLKDHSCFAINPLSPRK